MKKNSISDYYISDEIIASVVINAAKKCDGIFCFEKKPFKLKYLLHNGENLKYVNISESEDSFVFTLYITTMDGYSIPKAVSSVKENVKQAVEKVTEKQVSEVNVEIVSVHFDD